MPLIFYPLLIYRKISNIHNDSEIFRYRIAEKLQHRRVERKINEKNNNSGNDTNRYNARIIRRKQTSAFHQLTGKRIGYCRRNNKNCNIRSKKVLSYDSGVGIIKKYNRCHSDENRINSCREKIFDFSPVNKVFYHRKDQSRKQ